MIDIETAIQQTERYYREQIFSSGCSSMVPIYRIADHTATSESLVKQLDGSPYIQKEIDFSPRVIETLVSVNLYQYDEKHFFFQGDMDPEITKFLEQCEKVESFDKIIQATDCLSCQELNHWDESIKALTEKYPVLKCIDLDKRLSLIDEITASIEFNSAISGYLKIYDQQDWESKKEMDRSALICMVALAERLQMDSAESKELVALGMLKDIGYARLQDHINDFEIMHPLVSHKIVSEANADDEDANTALSEPLVNAVLLHHEFTDNSGPLARMYHPIVNRAIEQGIPRIAQISGICDLYLGFCDRYSTPVAFAITCGFVIGQGDLQGRYDKEVIQAFIGAFRAASYTWSEDEQQESTDLIDTVLALLKDPAVRNKASAIIRQKCDSGYDQITLALNIVRNIARVNPDHMGEASLVNALSLPVEFGLNYG